MQTETLAIDFGTSNSAAAILENGRPRRLPIETGSDTAPTAVFFPARGGEMVIGEAAAAALIGGAEGRYMRALKSVLGTTLFHESRLIGGRRQTLADVVTAFLVEVRARAEAQAGRRFARVLSGRPVHFHTADPTRDAQAVEDLRGCYLAAGFEAVRFLAEPEAAAWANHPPEGELGLIVDIGGGTSDFTVFAAERGRVRILASHGVRLGGTDFDQAVSLAHAMPLLGHGSDLRREFGSGLRLAPNGVFVDLATWAKIPFLYAAETRRAVAEMARLAQDETAFARLQTVLEDETGHQLAFAVEAGKIAANDPGGDAKIDMGFIEPGLRTPVTAESLDAALVRFRSELRQAAAETLRMADTAPARIGSVILVGGSSLMRLVTTEMQALCPAARQCRTEAFTAVVDGLALASGDYVGA